MFFLFVVVHDMKILYCCRIPIRMQNFQSKSDDKKWVKIATRANCSVAAEQRLLAMMNVMGSIPAQRN